MSEQTKIQWADSTWNPWRGCSPVSAGCQQCYARVQVNRFGGDFTKRVKSKDFNAPLRWNKRPWVCDECGTAYRDARGIPSLPEAFKISQPEAVVCCGVSKFHRRRVMALSLGDFLDPDVPIEWLAEMLDVIRRCPNLNFILPTKRPELFCDRMNGALAVADEWHMEILWEWLRGWRFWTAAPTNIITLASVENQEAADVRIPHLLKIPGKRGLSLEPLLGPIDLTRLCADESMGCSFNALTGYGDWNTDRQANPLDWVIVGGESGPKARPCNVEWIRSIKNQCQDAGVPCFVKQFGSKSTDQNGLGTYNDTTHPRGAVFKDGLMRTVRDPKGGDPEEWPEDLRVREWPKGSK